MQRPNEMTEQDRLYQKALDEYGTEIARFVTGYERNAAKRQDLQQEMQFAIWQSMLGFKQQCSLRTWVYRVAHNVGVSHIQRSMRSTEQHFDDLNELEFKVDESTDPSLSERQLDFARVLQLIYLLAALDRELMLLYLEGMDAAEISEITGLSTRNVATKIHRIKQLLSNQLNTGAHPHE